MVVKIDNTDKEALHTITLHQDITLTQKPNGLWDYGWDTINNDYHISTGTDSLYNACVLALLTGYNEIGRNNIPLYKDFGNKSYSLLKANKNNLTLHKIKSYFTSCLENIRRVQEVISLEVIENNNNIYTYKVYFQVLSITNEIIEGTINLNTDNPINTKLEIANDEIIDSLEEANNDSFTFTLTDKNGTRLPYQVVNLHINGELADRNITNENGIVSFQVPVHENDFHLYLTAENTPTTKHKTSSIDLDQVVILFHFHINDDGDLIYEYYDDFIHPDFFLNDSGELVMEYNDDTISFTDCYVNDDGFLIMKI